MNHHGMVRCGKLVTANLPHIKQMFNWLMCLDGADWWEKQVWTPGTFDANLDSQMEACRYISQRAAVSQWQLDGMSIIGCRDPE